MYSNGGFETDAFLDKRFLFGTLARQKFSVNPGLVQIALQFQKKGNGLRIGEILEANGILDSWQVNHILDVQKIYRRFWEQEVISF